MALAVALVVAPLSLPYARANGGLPGEGSLSVVLDASEAAKSETYYIPIHTRDLTGMSVTTVRTPEGDIVHAGPLHYVMKMASGGTDNASKGEFMVDTGSGVIGAYTSNTEEVDIGGMTCQEQYAALNEVQAIAFEMPSVGDTEGVPVSATSNACKTFIYAVPGGGASDTCPFSVRYVSGQYINGTVVEQDMSFPLSLPVLSPQTVQASRDNLGEPAAGLSAVNAATDGLEANLVIGDVQRANSCGPYPGIVGMDMSPSALVSQLVASKALSSHVMSICASVSGTYDESDSDDDFLLLGPGVPEAFVGSPGERLQEFGLFNGETIQKVPISDPDFLGNVTEVARPGISDHFFTVVENGLKVGNVTRDAPMVALVDTGYAALGVPETMLVEIHDEIQARAEAKGYEKAPCSGGFFVPSKMLAEAYRMVVDEVAPPITIRFAKEELTHYSIEGAGYMMATEIEESGSVMFCSALSPSRRGSQLALGTSFFRDRFVQFDWTQARLRIGDTTSCPSSESMASGTWATYTGPTVNGAQGMAPILALCVSVLVSTLLLS
jgi:hypothetical protein